MSYGLKPCPFCGSEEVYVEEYEHHPGAVRWRVLCAGCMAGIDTGTRQSAGAAVPDWNRRAERTCHDEAGSQQSFLCSECGWFWNDQEDDLGFSYCPNCGARVVEEE